MADTAIRSTPASDDEFQGSHHVYLPYRAGLPRLKPYIREVWRRREFLNELAASQAKVMHFDTFFGRLWNLLNPFLEGLTFFFLITILGFRQGGGMPHYFAYLMAGFFFFDILTDSVNNGTKSIIGSSKMIANASFPRVLLPLSCTRMAVRQFIPTIPVLILICFVSGLRPMMSWLVTIPFVIFMVIFAAGLAMLTATLQVYFRDMRNILPHLVKLWRYATPVIWAPIMLPTIDLSWMQYVNPAWSIVVGFNSSLILGDFPPLTTWLLAIFWSLATFIGGAYLFLSRERDFAIRI